VRGRRYKCGNSYVRREIVKRCTLIADKDWPDSIRLTWFEASDRNGGDQTKDTRFCFIDDDKIKCDIAIGQNHESPDPDPAYANDDDFEEMSDVETEDNEDHDDVSMQGVSEGKSNSEMGDRKFIGLPVPEVDEQARLGLYEASRGRPRMSSLQASSDDRHAMAGEVLGHAIHAYTSSVLAAKHRTPMPLNSGLDQLTFDNGRPSKRRKPTRGA
jgi:hypothetical protein